MRRRASEQLSMFLVFPPADPDNLYSIRVCTVLPAALPQQPSVVPLGPDQKVLFPTRCAATAVEILAKIEVLPKSAKIIGFSASTCIL